jgi:hypothetical protein
MAELFGLDIAKLVNDGLAAAGGVLDAELIKVVAGSRTAGNLTGGTNPSERPLRCKGFYDDAQLSRLPETLVQKGDRVAAILGASVPGRVEPEPGDKVTLEDETTTIQRIIERDPASALYLCQVRKT